MLQRSFEDHFHGFDLGNYFYIYHDAAYGLAYFAHAQSLFVFTDHHYTGHIYGLLH